MSSETDGRESQPSNAGSVASGYIARTAASTYATEALSAQEKHELIELAQESDRNLESDKNASP
jgi:hypothetical protein